MTESIFAAVRIAVLMILADGKVDPREQKWLISLLDTYGASETQRQLLQADFKDPPSLEELHPLVTNARDRERLMNWVRTVMNINDEIDANENALYRRLKHLNESMAVPPDIYQDYALSLLQHEAQNRFWKELEEAGRLYALRSTGIFARYALQRRFMIGLVENRVARWMLGILILFAIAFAISLIFLTRQ